MKRETIPTKEAKYMDKAFPALVWIMNILRRHNVPFLISGGFAAKLYGSPRELNDIDIDMPEENFNDILDDVRGYIIFGPDQYKDGKWDLYLMTLNYRGQEIDIGGAMWGKMSNKARTEWIHVPSDFSRMNIIEFRGLQLPVISQKNLIAYKSHLDGSHQQVDINAAVLSLTKTCQTI